MCGIFGMLGSHEVAPVILEALKRLEYRGYDSAGISTVWEGVLDRRRATGKLINLQDLLVREPLRGFAGIGHTRWATHGAASVANAHPHCTDSVAVVHNGIIENFRELRDELRAEGAEFSSETDTETIVLLVQAYLDQGLAPAEAAQATLARLDGAFALAFLFKGEEDLLIAARRGSPLVIGHGDGEMYVGSDAIVLAPLTGRLTYLAEGDLAIITRRSMDVRDAEGQQVERHISKIDVENATADKAGHKHFMAKEMAEQPSVIQRALAAYLDAEGVQLRLPEGVDFTGARRVVLIGCGTAFYACQVAKYWFDKLARIPVEIDLASEFRYRGPVVEEDDLVIVVSQSGETADTLAALRLVAGQVACTLAVVNVPTSSIAREADVIMPILAGPEIGVASTKAFTAQLLALLLLSLKAGWDRGKISSTALASLISELHAVPGLSNRPIEAACLTAGFRAKTRA